MRHDGVQAASYYPVQWQNNKEFNVKLELSVGMEGDNATGGLRLNMEIP